MASWTGKVVPIRTATNTMGKPIVLQSYYIGVTISTALSPNGRTLYAVSRDTLTPISTATDKATNPSPRMGRQRRDQPGRADLRRGNHRGPRWRDAG